MCTMSLTIALPFVTLDITLRWLDPELSTISPRYKWFSTVFSEVLPLKWPKYGPLWPKHGLHMVLKSGSS